MNKLKNKISILRDKLKVSCINFKEGRLIRKELHELALKHYVPKHSSEEYLQFIEDNLCKFSKNHEQSSNHPYYLTLFTIKSQHVMGDCAKECLDNAILHKKSEIHVQIEKLIEKGELK